MTTVVDDTETVDDVEEEVTPEVVDSLTAIHAAHGELTAEIVVAEAADEASPLHRYFDWDDASAANKYRCEQARALIRRCHITIKEDTTRAFVYVPSSNSYRPIGDAMSRPDWRDEVIANFKRDADAFAARWRRQKHVADAYKAWLREQLDAAS